MSAGWCANCKTLTIPAQVGEGCRQCGAPLTAPPTETRGWRWCAHCEELFRVTGDVCPECGGDLAKREKPLDPRKAPPADPRVVKPAGNREVKPR